MKKLYSILLTLALPFLLFRLYWRSRLNAKYRKHLPERFGVIPFHLDNCIWIHAVSVGEVMTAHALISSLLHTHKETPILITVTTPTGRDRVKALFSNNVNCCYLPFDITFILKGFIDKINPKLLIIMETELWPNLLSLTRQQKIKSILANGRLSPSSARAYTYIKSITKTMLADLSEVTVRDAKDAKRFLVLGLDPKKLHVIGNLKFNLTLPRHTSTLTVRLKKEINDRPVWIAASTHEGEEKHIITVHKQLLKQIPNLLLILVPRHQERFDKVHDLLLHNNLATITCASEKKIAKTTQVFLGDTMGHLFDYYTVSNVAFVGGSLVATGGHNVLEPIALGIPVITGPHTFNFTEIINLLLKQKATIQISRLSELQADIFSLLHDPKRCQSMAQNAKNILEQNQGALPQLTTIIQSLL